MSVSLVGYDREGDKVWCIDQPGDLFVTMNPTEQGAEWTFECGGGMPLDRYAKKFGPITEEKP